MRYGVIFAKVNDRRQSPVNSMYERILNERNLVVFITCIFDSPSISSIHKLYLSNFKYIESRNSANVESFRTDYIYHIEWQNRIPKNCSKFTPNDVIKYNMKIWICIIEITNLIMNSVQYICSTIVILKNVKFLSSIISRGDNHKGSSEFLNWGNEKSFAALEGDKRTQACRYAVIPASTSSQLTFFVPYLDMYSGRCAQARYTAR